MEVGHFPLTQRELHCFHHEPLHRYYRPTAWHLYCDTIDNSMATPCLFDASVLGQVECKCSPAPDYSPRNVPWQEHAPSTSCCSSLAAWRLHEDRCLQFLLACFQHWTDRAIFRTCSLFQAWSLFARPSPRCTTRGIARTRVSHRSCGHGTLQMGETGGSRASQARQGRHLMAS